MPEAARLLGEGVWTMPLTALAIILPLVHLFCLWKRRRGLHGRRLDERQFFPLPQPRRVNNKTAGRQPLVLVTGGAGFIGSAIVRQLREDDRHAVRVLDVCQPSDARRCQDVDYRVVDLCACCDEELACCLTDVDIIVHNAGLVVMSGHPNLLHNVHVYATARLLHHARLAGVEGVVGTSSTCVIHNGMFDLDAATASAPYCSEGTQYMLTKIEAEKMILAANCPASPDNDAAFHTCTIRLPGIYGYGDAIMVMPMLAGKQNVAPGREGVGHIDMLYVENAAWAHVCAVHRLCQPGPGADEIGGRAFLVSQYAHPREVPPILDFWRKARAIMAPELPRLRALPPWLLKGVASLGELVHWFMAGNVPFQRSQFWNLTRLSLGYMLHNQTTDCSETRRLLHYAPRVTTDESFRHIRAQHERAAEMCREGGAASEPPGILRSAGASEVEEGVVDWSPRPVSSSLLTGLLDRGGGPGATLGEHALTVCALAGTVAWVAAHAPPTWSRGQLTLAVLLAVIDGSAAVQCASATSKRWYHPGGRLSRRLLWIIVAEMVAQFVLVAVVHIERSDQRLTYLACVLPLFTSCALATGYTRLRLQRPTAVLCFLATLATLRSCVPSVPGMDWFPVIMAVKYLVSHIPRHEPYA